MLKIKSEMNVEVNKREYLFQCLPDSPLQDALEAVSQIQAFLIGKQEQAKLASEQKEVKEVEAVPA